MPAAAPKPRRARATSAPDRLLTNGQWYAIFPLFAAAWQAHCAASGQRASDGAAREQWRHEQLRTVLGLESMKDIPRSGDAYPLWMAHLEVIAGNGIYWQNRCHGAATRPLIHGLIDRIDELGIEQRYFLGIARQSLRLPDLTDLSTLSAAQLFGLRRLLEGLPGDSSSATREEMP